MAVVFSYGNLCSYVGYFFVLSIFLVKYETIHAIKGGGNKSTKILVIVSPIFLFFALSHAAKYNKIHNIHEIISIDNTLFSCRAQLL